MKNISHTRRAAALALTVIFAAAGALSFASCSASYEYTSGEVEWDSSYTAGKTLHDSYYYSDDWFGDDPSKQNDELALCSMQLTAAAVDDKEDGTGAAFLRDMGFEEVGFSDFNSDDPADCNYSWGRKSLEGGDLIAVVIQSRSGGDKSIQNKGWRQNVTVNDPDAAEPAGEHFGFACAADAVLEDIRALGGDGATYWITGQSRGGAIANVLAERLGEGGAKVFAYTFASPATVDAETADATACKYIHNYVCSDDLVTRIPLWGMKRYGSDVELKTEDTDEGLDAELEKLGSEAAGLKPRIVVGDDVERIIANLEAAVPSRADYSKTVTDKWTDKDGGSHELSYSYQDACLGMMDLVFSEDGPSELISGLKSRRGDLSGAIEHLSEGVKLDRSGGDYAAEYWEGTESVYAVLQDICGEKGVPVAEEDLYKALRVAAPVLIEMPEGGEADTSLLTDVLGYSDELKYSHQFDTLVARLKVLAPAPEK